MFVARRFRVGEIDEGKPRFRNSLALEQPATFREQPHEGIGCGLLRDIAECVQRNAARVFHKVA